MLPPEKQTIRVGGHSLSFDLGSGGRVSSWIFQGFELIGARGDDPVEHGCYPMAPWAGRIAGNSFTWNDEIVHLAPNYQEFALHGYLLDRPVELRDRAESPDSVDIAFTTVVTEWIAPVRIDMHWRIAEHEVQSTITASTHSLDPVPVVLGWHPWFNSVIGVGQETSIDYRNLQLAVKKDGYPSSEFVHVTESQCPFDDAFISSTNSVNIRWGSFLNLEISNSHEWFVIYNGAEGFTCVEPQTGPPNAFNDPLGCTTLTTIAGNPLSMFTSWRLTTL